MTTDDLAGLFRCLHDPACSTEPWPLDFAHSNRCIEANANANARRPDGLASLIAAHGSWRWTCDSDGFDTRDFGILCDCGKFIEAAQETDDRARIRHVAHQAEVIAAAGWVKPTPAWDPWLENDGEYEYSDVYHCDGTFRKRWKRKPRLRYEQDYTDWEEA